MWVRYAVQKVNDTPGARAICLRRKWIVPRFWIRRAVSRLVICALVVAVALTTFGPVTAARNAQAVSGSFFGLYGWSPDRPIERSSARQAGVGLAQVAVDWSLIEFTEAYNSLYFGTASGFDYTSINPVDTRIRAVVESGLEPIILIVNPPRWATQVDDTQGPLKSDKIAKYADFVRRLAVRYVGPPYNVGKIVLFPEPDHRQSLPFGCSFDASHRAWGDQPAQFASMLQQTYPVVKGAVPNTSIILGALAYDFFGGPNQPGFNSGSCGPYNFTFLDDVLAAGGANYVDIFAFNSYAVFGVGWEQQSQANGAYDVAAKTNYLRARFPQIAAKPTMVLESGVWSDPSVGIPVRNAEGNTVFVDPSAEWQAGYPAKLFARALSVGLQGVVWYGMRDYAGDVQRGLLDQLDQPKKSLQGYKQAALRLGGSTFQSTLVPRATASGRAEGYAFATGAGGRLIVLWAVGDLNAGARVTVDMPGGSIRGYDVAGSQQANLSVSGDQVTLDLTHSPIYLMSGPSQLRNLIPLSPRNNTNP
jgi:hypothetical protein